MPWAVGGRARPSIFFDYAMCANRGGGRGRRRESAGGDLPDFVEARRAAALSSLAPTVVALSLMFRDVLRLLRSGLMRTFLSVGG